MKKNHEYNYKSKIDEIYHREKSYDLHVKKLEDIRKKTASPHFPHVHVLNQRNIVREQRRRFDQFEKEEAINRMNGHLYQKINEIWHRPQSYDDQKNQQSLNITFRRQIAHQIQIENIKMASRLIRQEPMLKLEELKQQYKQQKQLVHRMSKFDQQVKYASKLRSHQQSFPKSQREPSKSVNQKMITTEQTKQLSLTQEVQIASNDEVTDKILQQQLSDTPKHDSQ